MKPIYIVLALFINSILLFISFIIGTNWVPYDKTVYYKGVIEGAKQQALKCEKLTLKEFNIGKIK